MTDPLARVEVEPERDGLRISLFGEIDLSNAQSLLEQLRGVIADAAPDRVLIDLTGVEYIDSQGVMLLLEVASTLRGTQTPLRLLAPAGSAAGQVLDISHLNDLPVERLTTETGG
jgi:anti-anti-sigma factor